MSSQEKDSGRRKCANCHCEHFYVVWVRHRRGKTYRRKACRHCGRQITTVETGLAEAAG